MNEHYRDQVRLLLDILPLVMAETTLALKGGTAINLFEWDLPRLSVDLDLTYLPNHGRNDSHGAIATLRYREDIRFVEAVLTLLTPRPTTWSRLRASLTANPVRRVRIQK